MWQGMQTCFKSEVTHLHTYPVSIRKGISPSWFAIKRALHNKTIQANTILFL